MKQFTHFVTKYIILAEMYNNVDALVFISCSIFNLILIF